MRKRRKETEKNEEDDIYYTNDKTFYYIRAKFALPIRKSPFLSLSMICPVILYLYLSVASIRGGDIPSAKMRLVNHRDFSIFYVVSVNKFQIKILLKRGPSEIDREYDLFSIFSPVIQFPKRLVFLNRYRELSVPRHIPEDKIDSKIIKKYVVEIEVIKMQGYSIIVRIIFG